MLLRAPKRSFHALKSTRIILLMTLATILVSCGEAASTWDDKRGRFVSTNQLKQEQRERDRDQDRRLDRLEAK